MRIIFLSALFLMPGMAATCRADDWVLEQSTITYFVSHPLHHVEGISHAARGKGVCKNERCDVLIGVQVKSFDSGDSNRDLHMLQVTRGGDFPMVAVRTSFPEKSTGATIVVDLDIQFAGKTVSYKKIKFQRLDHDDQSLLSGTIPLKISDFGIIAPSLLAVPIKDDVPIKVETAWRKKPS
jgi:hypothetical protein